MKILSHLLQPSIRLFATATLLAGFSQAVATAQVQGPGGGPAPEFDLEILTEIPSGAGVFDINNQGQIVGQLAPQSQGGTGEAFLLENGQLTAFMFPNALASIAVGINEHGGIYGSYISMMGVFTGVYLDTDGSAMDIFFPGSAGTLVFGGNNDGDAVGIYFDANTFEQRSFLRTAEGVYSTLTPPGNNLATDAVGINDSGVITGDLIDGTGTYHGWVLSNGIYTIIDVPDSMSTSAARVSERGDMVGTYSDFGAGAFGQGFFRTRNGTYHELTYPDPSSLTQLGGVSDNGRHVVGTAFYADGSSISFAFNRIR